MNNFIQRKNGIYRAKKTGIPIVKLDVEEKLKERFPNNWIPVDVGSNQPWGHVYFRTREQQHNHWINELRIKMKDFIEEHQVGYMDKNDFVLLYEMYHDVMTPDERDDLANQYNRIRHRLRLGKKI